MDKTLLQLLEQQEGFKGNPYHDVAGVLTVGYGTTFPISQGEAEALLELREAGFQVQIAALVTHSLGQNQLDALTSLVYNIGIGAFHKSGLLTAINNKDKAVVEANWKLWIHSGGKVIQDLIDRRNTELILWNTPDSPVVTEALNAAKKPTTEQQLSLIVSMLQQLLNQGAKMATDLSTLAAAVATDTSVDQSAVTLIQGLAAQLAAAGTDPVALAALVTQMNANATALAAAVSANTPAGTPVAPSAVAATVKTP